MYDVHRHWGVRVREGGGRVQGIVYIWIWRGPMTPSSRRSTIPCLEYVSEPRWRSRVPMSTNSNEFVDAGGAMTASSEFHEITVKVPQ